MCREETARKGTTTNVKVTMLDPVLMLPQDDTDPDSTALFLQVKYLNFIFCSSRFRLQFFFFKCPLVHGKKRTFTHTHAFTKRQQSNNNYRYHQNFCVFLCLLFSRCYVRPTRSE